MKEKAGVNRQNPLSGDLHLFFKIALIINEKRGSKEKIFAFVIRKIPPRPVWILVIW